MIERGPVIQKVREFIEQHGFSRKVGICVSLSLLVCRLLIRQKRRAILQAGTCMWPRVLPSQDDGVSPTHFSYVWEWSVATRERCRACLEAPEGVVCSLPEIHCWVALPDLDEIVDAATGFFPDQCKRLLGLDWPGTKPPPYFWGGADDLPEDVVYRPDVRAIKFVLELLGRRRTGWQEEQIGFK